MRYLVRLANKEKLSPRDTPTIQSKIRKVLGFSYKIGNLRLSSSAIEFDLFAEPTDLPQSKRVLESISEVISIRPLDVTVPPRAGEDSLREGVDLFNHERYWEAHETLEEVWHKTRGTERDVLQGMILTAAALVHYQKNENTVSISILGRAREKLLELDQFRGLDIKRLRLDVEKSIEDKIPSPLRIKSIATKDTSRPTSKTPSVS